MAKESGVYKIVNEENGKYYIGSSKDMRRRWREHKRLLNKGTHINSYLQNAWNKYGEASFSFAIIKKCDPGSVIEMEQKLLDDIFEDDTSNAKSYNISHSACGGIVWKGEYPEEARKKLSKKMKNRVVTEETRKKMSEAFTGRVVSPEARRNISLAAQGRVISEETKAKISKAFTGLRSGDKHPLYGKSGEQSATFGRKHTDEEKKRMSEACMGRYEGDKHPKARKVVQVSMDGKVVNVFTTIKEAAAMIGRTTTSIHYQLQGNTKHCAGFKWFYLEDYQEQIKEQEKS